MAATKDESRLFDYYCVVSNFDSKGREVYGEGSSNVLCRWPQEDYENFPLPPCISMFCLYDEIPPEYQCTVPAPNSADTRFSTMTGNGGSHSYCIYISFLDSKTLTSDKKPIRFAICIVTHNPFFSLFKSILSYIFYAYKEKNVVVDIKKKYWAIPDLISTPINNSNSNSNLKLESTLSQIFINNIVKKDNDPTIVKLPGFEYSITLKTSLNQLPYTDPICFYTLFFSLDINNIVEILSYMIQEQKILFYSSNVSTIEFCCEALISLLYPFYWQHVYIPIVPLISLDYLNIPLPSLLGICNDALASPICAQIMSSRVVVNLDRNTVISPISINEDNSSTGMIKLPTSIENYFINQFNTMLYKNEMLVTGQNRTNDPTTINWINNIRIVSQSGFYPLLSPIMPMINEIQTADPEILLEKGILNKIPKEFVSFMKSFLETQMFQSFLQDYIDNDPSLQLFIFGLKEYNNNKHKIDPVVKILCDNIQEPVIINHKYIDDIENSNNNNNNNNNKEKDKSKHKLNIPKPQQSPSLLRCKPLNQFPFFDDKQLQINGRMRSSSSNSNSAMTLTRNSIGWHTVDFDINTLDLVYIGNTDKDKNKSSLKLVIKNRSQSINDEEILGDCFSNCSTNPTNITTGTTTNANNNNLLDIISELKTPDSRFNSNNGGGGGGNGSNGDINFNSVNSGPIIDKDKENISNNNNNRNSIKQSLKINHSSSENDLSSLSIVTNTNTTNTANTASTNSNLDVNTNLNKFKIICSDGIITNESPYNLLRNPSARISRMNCQSRRNTISIMSGINEDDTIESITNKVNNNNKPIQTIETITSTSPSPTTSPKTTSQNQPPPPPIPVAINNNNDLQPLPHTDSLIINEKEDNERESDMAKLPHIKTPPLDRRLIDDLTKNSNYEERIKSMDLSSSMKGDKRRPFAKLRKNCWSSMKSDLKKENDLSQSVNLTVQKP